jgi:hypothetical protein
MLKKNNIALILFFTLLTSISCWQKSQKTPVFGKYFDYSKYADTLLSCSLIQNNQYYDTMELKDVWYNIKNKQDIKILDTEIIDPFTFYRFREEKIGIPFELIVNNNTSQVQAYMCMVDFYNSFDSTGLTKHPYCYVNSKRQFQLRKIQTSLELAVINNFLKIQNRISEDVFDSVVMALNKFSYARSGAEEWLELSSDADTKYAISKMNILISAKQLSMLNTFTKLKNTKCYYNPALRCVNYYYVDQGYIGKYVILPDSIEFRGPQL